MTGTDILIGKTSSLPEPTGLAATAMIRRQTKRDCSKGMRPQEKGIVDKVMLSTDKDGQKIVKMRVCALARHESLLTPNSLCLFASGAHD